MPTFRRIVCPTDFSVTARRACDYAAEIARTFAAEVILLHVVPQLDYPMRSFGMAVADPHLHEELGRRAREVLATETQRLDPATRIVTEVREGVVHEQIIACAKAHEADLIVMGTHGHTGLAHFVLGSTTERVVRMAQCPVLTVRTPG